MSEVVSDSIIEVQTEVESPAPANCEASAVVAEILKLAHRLRARLAQHFSEFGLTDIRFCVLRIIRDAPHGGCTQARLAEELNQSESSISTLIDRMRGSNLLYRLRSPEDRRKRTLILSDHGRQLLEDAERNHDERMAALLFCFDELQLKEFHGLLRRLQERLEMLEAPETVGGLEEAGAPDSLPRAA